MPTGNPTIELQKAQLALSGSVLTSQKQTNSLLMDMLGVLKTIEARLVQDSTKQEVTEPDETVEVSQEEEKKALVRQLKEIEALNLKVDKLMA
jgi:hypothetical protein